MQASAHKFRDVLAYACVCKLYVIVRGQILRNAYIWEAMPAYVSHVFTFGDMAEGVYCLRAYVSDPAPRTSASTAGIPSTRVMCSWEPLGVQGEQKVLSRVKDPEHKEAVVCWTRRVLGGKMEQFSGAKVQEDESW